MSKTPERHDHAGSPTSPRTGRLFVVATPIGNLGDLSVRAREVLGSVHAIAAEDTRHTGTLLKSMGIDARLLSLHEHNEARRSADILDLLLAGHDVALVSDAGTPLISDPGFDIVATARARGLDVIAVPGPSAVIAALSIAGLPTDRFVFEGFLPAKSGPRVAHLRKLASETRTLVFYEAPHRLQELLADLAEVFGSERRAVIAREITKRFESTYDGTLGSLHAAAAADPDMSRGELVVVVSGNSAPPATASEASADDLLRALLDELPPSQAAKVAARLTGAKRSALYEKAMSMGGKGEGEGKGK